jgi:hypothetical protein
MNQTREERREYSRQYRATHRADIQAYSRQYYATHRAASQAYSRQYKVKNIKNIKVYMALRYINMKIMVIIVFVVRILYMDG